MTTKDNREQKAPKEMIDELADKDPVAWMVATDSSQPVATAGISYDLAANEKEARELALPIIKRARRRRNIEPGYIFVEKKPNGWHCKIYDWIEKDRRMYDN